MGSPSHSNKKKRTGQKDKNKLGQIVYRENLKESIEKAQYRF